MNALHEKSGSAARRLLGGDERLHVFKSAELADAYLARVPGSRTYAPRKPGWGNVLHDAITGVVRARDASVEIEYDHRAEPQSAEVALEIAVALYDRGAHEVKIGGATVRMPARLQVWR